ncbi:uncharacterized protein [Clytia hemisphaerica]|uniref:Uncharacterized protein n=1 Tax=Clytia hemisphaerica TaxID=252671 RepID=A0A7M5XJP8_9CNID
MDFTLATTKWRFETLIFWICFLLRYVHARGASLKCYSCVADTIEDCNRTQFLEYCPYTILYPSCFTVTYEKVIQADVEGEQSIRKVVQKKCGSQLNGCHYECGLHKMLGARKCYATCCHKNECNINTGRQIRIYNNQWNHSRVSRADLPIILVVAACSIFLNNYLFI